MDSKKKTALSEEEEKWLTDEFWPIPKWLEKDEGYSDHKDYNAYLKYNLRTRYYELEGDFRTTYYNFAPSLNTDFGTARRIVEFLRIARQALEGKEVDLLAVANLLDLAERYMIWLFPDYSAKQRVLIRAKHLEANYPKYAAALYEEVEKSNTSSDKLALHSLKAAYDEVIGDLNKHNIEDQVSFGLQIQRLELLRSWGIVSLLLAVFVLSFLINFEGLNNPDTDVTNALFDSLGDVSPFLLNLCLTIGIGLMGALGGFISGLLQVRNTKVGLIEFKESLLKFQLKPIVGGLTAILITVLLSWQILPGIKIENLGSFILIAFLTGFSERYFLKLLKIDKEEAELSMVKTEGVKDESMPKET